MTDVINFASIFDDATAAQAQALANLPFVYPYIALMPDAHVGKGSAVGTVIPTIGAVIPAAVGVDIGCGMVAARTVWPASALEGKDLTVLRDSLESSIPLSPGNYNKKLDRFPFTAARIAELEELAEERGVDLSHSPKWREQLGSLGGGNHFIELCVDQDHNVWMFLHSGSRGVGNKIAQKHIKIAQKMCSIWHVTLADRDHAFLPEAVPEFGRYITELNWAQRFALLNRAEMMDRFARSLAHFMGQDTEDIAAIELERINTHHNYTVKQRIAGKDVWLTRKGAIDASEGVRGLIPGSMGTQSYVVTGKGNPKGLFSAPHGAGRAFSRTEAKKRFTAADLEKAMDGIVYRHGDAWIDEIPAAYKSIDQVIEDAKDLVDITHTLRQVLNVKGT